MLEGVRRFAVGLVSIYRGGSYGSRTGHTSPPASRISHRQTQTEITAGFMGNRASNTTSKINQPYHTLVEDAVAVLKERPGSTQQDIFKFLESKYNGKIPVQIRKTLTVRLRSTIKKSQLEAKKAGASPSRSSPSDAQLAASSRGTGAGGLRGRPPKKRLNACNNKRGAAAGTSTRKSSLATRKGGRRNARRRSRNRVKFAPGTKTQKTKSKKLYDKVRHPTPRP